MRAQFVHVTNGIDFSDARNAINALSALFRSK